MWATERGSKKYKVGSHIGIAKKREIIVYLYF